MTNSRKNRKVDGFIKKATKWKEEYEGVEKYRS